MNSKQLMSELMLALMRALPRCLHTPAVRARFRVERLDLAQRRELADNLRQILRPDAA